MKRIVMMLLALCALASGAEAPLPVGVAHGLAVYRWLDGAMLGALLPSDTPNTSKAYTWSAMQTMTASPTSLTLTGVPTGTTSTTSTLVVNPASATANADLIWAGIAGAQKFQVDEDGDVYTQGLISFKSGSANLNTVTLGASATAGLRSLAAGGTCIYGYNSTGQYKLTVGLGCDGEYDVTAHLDQDDVLIKRDVDLTAGGGGPYNEAGSLLHLHRDVTNGGTISGNFFECSTDGATPLFHIDKGGSLTATGSPTSATLTGVPTGTTSTTSTLVVNPASATANACLIWAGVNGTYKFRVDEDGDFICTRSFAVYAGKLIFQRYDVTTGLITNDYDNGLVFAGNDGIGQYRMRMGVGAAAQIDVTAHLDQDDVLIKRDVDLTAGGGGPYNEAGALLHLHRDVTNGGTIAGNFLECSTDGATPLFKIPKDGGIVPSGNVDLATNNAVFLPRRIRQAAEPVPAAGEMLIWSDSDDDSVWLVYSDADGGVVTVQLN